MSRETKKTLGVFILISSVYMLIFFAFDIKFFPLIYGLIINLFILGGIFAYGYLRKEKPSFERLKDREDLGEDARIILREYQALDKKYKDLLIAYEDLDGSLKDFYALWIHEIKTPIAENRLILSEKDPDIDLLIKNNKKIDGFVDILLAFLRGTSKTNDYIFKDVDLEGLIKERVREKSYDFINKRISLDMGEISYKTVSDRKRLGFIISQALTNSLKYTKEGGRVKIYIKDRVLFIEDNGIGIKKSDLKRIFEMGYIGENGRTYGRSTGLGLYLVKKISKDLNLEVKIESKENAYSKFMVKFDNLAKM